MLKEFLFRIAKAPFMGRIIGNAFRFCGSTIPVKKVLINRDVISFVHPKPCYPNHIILSPRKAISDLHQLTTDAEGFYFAKIWEAAMQLARTKHEYAEGFMLVANGGKKQEVSQVHFHMYTGEDDALCADAGKVLFQDDVICVSECSASNGKKHYSLKSRLPDALGISDDSVFMDRLIQRMANLTADINRDNQSCSLVFRYEGKAADQPLVFHFFQTEYDNLNVI